MVSVLMASSCSRLINGPLQPFKVLKPLASLHCALYAPLMVMSSRCLPSSAIMKCSHKSANCWTNP